MRARDQTAPSTSTDSKTTNSAIRAWRVKTPPVSNATERARLPSAPLRKATGSQASAEELTTQEGSSASRSRESQSRIAWSTEATEEVSTPTDASTAF